MKVSSTRLSRAGLVATVSLMTSLALAPAAQGGAARFRVAGIPEASGPTISVDKSLLRMERAAQAGGENRMVSVIVKLSEESLASNRGKLPGLAATSPRTLGTARLDTRSTVAPATSCGCARSARWSGAA